MDNIFCPLRYNFYYHGLKTVVTKILTPLELGVSYRRTLRTGLFFNSPNRNAGDSWEILEAEWHKSRALDSLSNENLS